MHAAGDNVGLLGLGKWFCTLQRQMVSKAEEDKGKE